MSADKLIGGAIEIEGIAVIGEILGGLTAREHYAAEYRSDCREASSVETHDGDFVRRGNRTGGESVSAPGRSCSNPFWITYTTLSRVFRFLGAGSTFSLTSILPSSIIRWGKILANP